MSHKLIKNELGFLQVDPMPYASELEKYYNDVLGKQVIRDLNKGSRFSLNDLK